MIIILCNIRIENEIISETQVKKQDIQIKENSTFLMTTPAEKPSLNTNKVML